MHPLIERVIAYSCAHPFLIHAAHAAGGFGLAIILQHWLKGHSFVSVWVGWLLVAFSVAVHVMAVMK